MCVGVAMQKEECPTKQIPSNKTAAQVTSHYVVREKTGKERKVFSNPYGPTLDALPCVQV